VVILISPSSPTAATALSNKLMITRLICSRSNSSGGCLRCELEMDIAVAFLKEKQRLLNDLVQVVRGEVGRRQTGEIRKFIDEFLQLVDLLDNGRSTLIQIAPLPSSNLAYRFRSRSADNWMGVSGFLIS